MAVVLTQLQEDLISALKNNKKEQAGAELCQAQVKLEVIVGD